MTIKSQIDAAGFVDVDNFAPFERHVMPNLTEVYYVGGDRHEYFRDVQMRGGKWCGKGKLAGTSTVVKVFDSGGDGLLNWAAKLTCEGVAELLDDHRADALYTGDKVWEALYDAELTWKDIRNKAASRGTNVHRDALNAMAEGRPVPDFDGLTPEEQGYARGVTAFWHEHDPDPVLSEQVVADLDLGVAGRFDLVYRSRSGVRTLLDLKTVEVVPRKKKRPFYPVTHQVQVAGYGYLLERSGFDPVTALSVLYVDSGGDYELVPGCAGSDDFRLALQVYHSAAEIRAAGSAARKAAA